MELMNFQKKAIKELFDAMSDENVHEIILKSPTGSGKTIMLTRFMKDYSKENLNTVFLWLTPGKGDLEEQSKAKMDKYIYDAHTKLLSDIMINGFEDGDACFINWEKLTKKGNNALKDSERTNFLEWIEKATSEGLSFKIIIDESHNNFTAKADEIIGLFKTDKIIRASATPKKDNKAKLIEIKEEDVIAEGLIKKLLIINENFPGEVEIEDRTAFLLEKAIKKRTSIYSTLVGLDAKVNPLIIVQLPNKSTSLLEVVEKYLEKQNITVENGLLSIWLSDRHENIGNISDNNAPPIVLVMKQAIATGWDCPRAYILVKLRENMDETFEVQTIGRIRRMAEAHHYENHLLDNCYLYTFDEKFKEGVRTALGGGALEEKTLFLKNEHKDFKLISEQRKGIGDVKLDAQKLRSFIRLHFEKKYGLTSATKENKVRLQTFGFNFSETIDTYTKSGSVSTISKLSQNGMLNNITIKEKANTHKFGRDFLRATDSIAREISNDYSTVRTITYNLFCRESSYRDKLLLLEVREWYAFVINNVDILRYDFREALAVTIDEDSRNLDELKQLKEFTFPPSLNFTYNANSKVQQESKKNVYKGYLLSAEPRSSAEKKFEKYAETSEAVDWVYKNGDKGQEYFSILYEDNSGKSKLFYPDYIISVKGETWIIETKGCFDKEGESEDIDIYSPKKFEALKNYLQHHHLKGGFVRYDKDSETLCICTDNYSDDISSSSWQILSELF